MDIDDTSPPKPFRIGLLLVDGFALMSYASTVEPLRAANLLAGQMLYSIIHLAVSGERATSSIGAEVRANAQLNEQQEFDLVLVVAGGDPGTFRDERVFLWLRQLARRGIWLGGVSGGPVILAAAGVMQGRRMAVHWEHAPLLAEVYPLLPVERSLYVMDRDRLTCSGGTAPLDMMHALITRHHGIDFACRVSDWFMHTAIRASGEPQRAGLVERYNVHNPVVLTAIDIMRNHLGDLLDLQQLAHLSGVGERQLNRLFHDHLGQSTMTFYRELRLELARTLLIQSPLSITDVALATGFGSSAHFSRAFRARYGVAPSGTRGAAKSYINLT